MDFKCHKNKSYILGCFVLLSILGYVSYRIFYAPQMYSETKILMDTVINVKVYGVDKKSAIADAFYEFERIQVISDHFDPNSQVSKINDMAGISPVEVDEDLLKMINDAIQISEKTDGAFDISIGPLTDLWGIGHKTDFVPTQEEIDKVLPLIDYRKIEVDNEKHTVYLPQKGMQLDLGGVAKDYAVNRAIEALQKDGVHSAVINAGGDVEVIGSRPDGAAWTIGVQNPRDKDGIVARVPLKKAWNMTQSSGDYQRFFIKDGQRYAHIINPKTGKQPTELSGVTLVYDSSAIEGDIASSGFLVLGLDRGMKALEKFPGVEAIFVKTDGDVILSPGLQNNT